MLVAFKHFGSSSIVPSSATCKHQNKLESRTDCFLNRVNYSFYAIWIFKVFCRIWNVFVSHKETCFSDGRMNIVVVFLTLTSYCLLHVIFDLYSVFSVAVSTVCLALPYSIRSCFLVLLFIWFFPAILWPQFVLTTAFDFGVHLCSYQRNRKNRNFTQTYIVAVKKVK